MGETTLSPHYILLVFSEEAVNNLGKESGKQRSMNANYDGVRIQIGT